MAKLVPKPVLPNQLLQRALSELDKAAFKSALAYDEHATMDTAYDFAHTHTWFACACMFPRIPYESVYVRTRRVNRAGMLVGGWCGLAMFSRRA